MVLNEILAEFRSGDGYARPNRYEVCYQPPTGDKGGSQYKIYFLRLWVERGDGTVRRTALDVNQYHFLAEH